MIASIARIAVLFLTMGLHSYAHAAEVNFSGHYVDMGRLHIGQHGSISAFTAPNSTRITGQVVAEGILQAILPARSSVVFSYTFHTSPSDIPRSISMFGHFMYESIDRNNVYWGYGTASSSTRSGPTPYNTETYAVWGGDGPTGGEGLYDRSHVFATANLNGSYGATAFGNMTSNFSNITNIITFFSSDPQFLDGTSVTYAVSSIPLPATLPLFAMAVFGMAGCARYRRSCIICPSDSRPLGPHLG